jgi:WD40 repeat protein
VRCHVKRASLAAGVAVLSFEKNDLLMKRLQSSRCVIATLLGGLLGVSAFAADPAPVSFEKQILPIMNASCAGCHQPGKAKGGLDVTTYQALATGGKKGPSWKVGHPEQSYLVEQISGDKPEMPAKGDPLSKAEVELISRWIKEGAKNDSTVVAAAPPGSATPGPSPLAQPPVYSVPPVITALAFSPDGQTLAVSGYYEVVLHRGDGAGLIGRLVGGSPRVLSMAFAPDGQRLAVAGGAPGQYGNVQLWDLKERKLAGNWKTASDTVFGVSFSPSGEQLAFGCPDKSARVISAADGKEILRLDQHTDWCVGAVFTVDGKRLLTGGRDQAMKLSAIVNAQFIDDVNNPLDPITSMARHPKEDLVVYGGANGSSRIYKIADNQARTAGRNDTNLVKELERQPAGVNAVAWNADGTRIAVAAENEAKVFDPKGGKIATLPGHDGAIFAVAFSPDGQRVATGGHDGLVRVFELPNGKIKAAFVPVPLSTAGKTASK